MIPKWLSSYINEADLLEIEKSVALAESKTSGEIVPMIVRESSASGHVPYTVSILLFAFFILALPTVSMRLPFPFWSWEIAAAILSGALGWASARSSIVRRAFTPAHDQALAVFHRAQLEFHETGIPGTAGHTGVLIFISVHERRAVVLGDKAISAHFKDETWVGIINGLLAHIRKGEMRSGLTAAVAEVGNVLAREFPIQTGDTNELPNGLIVKD